MELVGTEGSVGVGQLMVDIVAGLVEVVGEKRTTDDERVHWGLSVTSETRNPNVICKSRSNIRSRHRDRHRVLKRAIEPV